MASKPSLLDSDSESDGPDRIKINQKYAADFQSRKQKEELRQVRFEEGSVDSSSSSESEDEDGRLLTDRLDLDIMKMINALRSKDAKIYDPNTRFFEQQQGESSDSSSPVDKLDEPRPKRSKQKRYKDILREQVLEKIERENELSEEDDDEHQSEVEKAARFAYDAQQHEIRQAFLDSTKHVDSDEGSENLITMKQRHNLDEDSDQARQELLEQIQKLEDSMGKAEKSEFIDPRGEVKDGEKFLLDYFKKKTWIEKGDENSFPESDEGSATAARTCQGDDGGHESDESLEQLEKADDFEAKYNFRFEEATAGATSGADFSLMSYAREGTNTLRRKDDSRREKRLARQERKEAERRAKEEQLKRLKNAKRHEMEEKLNAVKAVLGDVEARGATVDEVAIMKLLEGDFDPDKFEELMKETYGDDFYAGEDAEWKTDKDVRESLKREEDGDLMVGQDDEDGGLYDNVQDDDNEGPQDGYDGDWYEEDEEPVIESQLQKNIKSRMIEELYKLDYEDIIAGEPTRFKYRKVTPSSYGLSTEEILLARDTTLKQFVSLKKMAPYAEQDYVVNSRKRRRFREMLRSDIDQEEAKLGQDKSTKGNDSKQNDQSSDPPKARKKSRRLKKGKKSTTREGEKSRDGKTTMEKGDLPMEEHAREQDKPSDTSERREPSREPNPASELMTGALSNPVARRKNRRSKKRNHGAVSSATGSRLASYGL